jgi:hypothetical protein
MSDRFTWVGVAVAAVGFVLIAIAWAQIAGEDQVYRQLPYLASAGLTGLGLIVLGATVINVSVKRKDAGERERQMEQLLRVLSEIKEAQPAKRGSR